MLGESADLDRSVSSIEEENYPTWLEKYCSSDAQRAAHNALHRMSFKPILPAYPPCMHTCMQELAQRRANCYEVFKTFRSSHGQGPRDDVIRSAAVCWRSLPCRTRSRCPCDSCRSEALSSCLAAVQAQGGMGSRTAQQTTPSAVCPTPG
jgi:hypothetical protein